MDISWKASDSDGNAISLSKYLITWSASNGSSDATFTTGLTARIIGLNSNTEYIISVTPEGEDRRTGDASDALRGYTSN